MEKEALKHFRNCVVKGLDMLMVRFDLEMVEEVNLIIQPELQHLLNLARQWDGKTTEKVSIRSLLRLKKVGKTRKSKIVTNKKFVQTMIPNYFKKNAKRSVPGDAPRVVPNKKAKSAPSLSYVEANSDFSDELILNNQIDSNDSIRNPEIENTGVLPDGAALMSSEESSDESSKESSSSEEDEESSAGDGDSVEEERVSNGPTETAGGSEIRDQVIDILDSDVGRAVIDSVI